MTRAYELAVVLNPELSDGEIERLRLSLKALVEKYQGQVTDEEVWGRKTTAFKLKGHDEGFYAFFTINLDSDQVFALDQAIKLTDDVLRHLITIKEETAKNE